VVIFGGGIAGVQLAKKLGSEFKVTLVDPNDYFEVPMAAPRNLVRPAFAEKAIIPYAEALPNVSFVQGALVEMGADAGTVETREGNRVKLAGDVLVLCTGSIYANPLMRSSGASALARKHLYRQYRQAIENAQRILIVGGGPVGVEVAGEISESFPSKTLTLLEAGPRILAGTSEVAAKHAASVLRSRGVSIIVGEKLQQSSASPAEAISGKGEATTTSGRKLSYDLLVWCTGGRPNTAYMAPALDDTLNERGQIRVGTDLRVKGHGTLFALGDITDLDENKMAWHIGGQIGVAAENIRRVLKGRGLSSQLKAYKPQTGSPKMAVTLGSRQGVVHMPPIGVIRSPFLTRKAKAEHMFVPQYRGILGVDGK
jgi:NADH dehydrogenase FAD-containing subunit